MKSTTKQIKRPAAGTLPKKITRAPAALDPRAEEVFGIWRDMGATRTFRRLEAETKIRWPLTPIALSTLSLWSTRGDWKKRLEDYEQGLSQGQPAMPSLPTITINADDPDALEAAASQALTRIVGATNLQVTRPSDVKALVDVVNRLFELAQRKRDEKSGTSTPQQIAAFGGQMLDLIVEARRRDVVALVKAAVEAACAEAGTTNMIAVLKKTSAAVGLRVTDEGEIDAATPPTQLSTSSVDEVLVGSGDTGSVGNSKIVEEVYVVESNSNEALVEDDTELDEIMRKLSGEC